MIPELASRIARNGAEARRARLAPTLAAMLVAGLAAPAGAEDVVYTVVDGIAIPEPLSAAQPNADRGGVIYLDPKRGGCGACHRTASLPDQVAEGAAAPNLDGVAERYDAAELRLMIVNPRIRRPDSAMPAYFNVSAEIAAQDPEAPQPLLTAREVEDVIAFLQTLAPD